MGKKKRKNRQKILAAIVLNRDRNSELIMLRVRLIFTHRTAVMPPAHFGLELLGRSLEPNYLVFFQAL